MLGLYAFTFLLIGVVTAQDGSICAGKGTLGERIGADLQNLDPDGNSVITSQEVYNNLVQYYDTDKDNCLSKTEWVNQWVNSYNLSKEFASHAFIGDETKTCQFDINFYKTYPNDTSQDQIIAFLISNLVDTCNADPTAFTSNCDCAQLRSSCESDSLLWTNDECVKFLACDGMGDLESRLKSNLRANDPDDDKTVTAQEIAKDVSDNYDVDNDGCVDQKEWVDRWTNYFKFSPEYALSRFNGIMGGNASCPIDINFYQNTPIQIKIEDFMDANVQTLVDLCRVDVSQTDTNCDCLQLPDLCNNAAFFKDLNACSNYTASTLG